MLVIFHFHLELQWFSFNLHIEWFYAKFVYINMCHDVYDALECYQLNIKRFIILYIQY